MLVLLYSLLVFLALFIVISFFSSGIFNKMINVVSAWSSPYECGFASSSLSFNCFSFTYFSLLVFFVVFDLEISLLLNLPEQGLLFNNFFYYFSFLLILVFGFLSEIILGYVRWGY
uniref:NADH-ubiquinone oxidoreductase chain 3 n=1 Tax=Rhinebothrium sp. 3 DJM-2021 TaxID=2899517 RepID=A0A8K1SWP2_9CEST|nr:NADH dehydrogenase subunit 3 [Rhinebothrium sp. 3 DJM-2021]UFQ88511.1 NADH dehydrogenase subunit 3 [Rhinebothrium sp. 3 DJM-2021]UFQ88535.1 NADH dehydrogenase subunit 3 [Rhinebothrium sp. 3 DJM-2021]UFQ88547.1 NADH dehydrogenase subunit 3 [Rhinebothrium sp. 3 DJM-2021]